MAYIAKFAKMLIFGTSIAALSAIYLDSFGTLIVTITFMALLSLERD